MGALLGLALLAPGAAFAQQQPAPAVYVEPAALSDLRPSVSFTGRLKAVQKVEIRARISGFLQEILFEEGATVSAGDTLYRVEPDAYQATVDQTQGEIISAEAEKRLAEIEVERKQRLVERDVASQSELDVAEADVGKAEGAIKRLQAQLERAELDLSYTTIAAPFEGVVGLTNVDVGAFVEPSTGALTTLTRLHPMTVEFPVTTADLLRYRTEAEAQGRGANGNEAKVEIVLPDGTTYGEVGEIDFIDAEVNRGTDTVIVRAVFPNEDSILLDGALVGVRLEQTASEMVVNVPQTAVQRDMLGAFVMVVDDTDTVEQRRVESPRVTEGRAVISSGLKEGERVITEGVNKVRPGIKVDAALAPTFDASEG